jgi:hypothetical protein
MYDMDPSTGEEWEVWGGDWLHADSSVEEEQRRMAAVVAEGFAGRAEAGAGARVGAGAGTGAWSGQGQGQGQDQEQGWGLGLGAGHRQGCWWLA